MVRSAVALFALAFAACGTPAAPADDVTDEPAAPDTASLNDAKADGAGAWTRDWKADPAVVTLSAPGKLYAVSDVHGGYARLVNLLAAEGLSSVSRSGVVAW